MKSCLHILILLSGILLASHGARFYSRQNCNHSLQLRNGDVTCYPQGANYASCRYTCGEEYTLIGRSRVTCRVDSYYHGGADERYLWSDRAPYCRPKECPLQEPVNADVFCSGTGRKPGDYCRYLCFNGYQRNPSDRVYQDCLQNGYWSPAPCCAEQTQCSHVKKADVVIALDSSIKFGSYRWFMIKDFMRGFIDVQEDMTRFSIFRYDRRVDEENSILLREFVDDRLSLLETYDAMPDELATGHYVDNALSYIARTVLREENGDRPDARDIILLITKDHSDDTGYLQLPVFHTDPQPKVIVVTVDYGDAPLQQQIQLQQAQQYSTDDPREYWQNITGSLDGVYMAESHELAGLNIALKRDLHPYVCQIEGCNHNDYV